MPLTGAEYRRVASRGALLARAQSELAACDPEGFEAIGIVDRRLEAERGDRADTRHARFGDGPLTKEHPDGQDTRAALRPSKATHQILPSMDKDIDINDDTPHRPKRECSRRRGGQPGPDARAPPPPPSVRRGLLPSSGPLPPSIKHVLDRAN